MEVSRSKPNIRNRVEPAVEQAVLDLAIEDPSLGQKRASNELRERGVFISAAGVRGVWLRHGLEVFQKRLKALEAHVAKTGAVLTDRGTEYCGKPDTHEYQLFLALADIEHTKTKAKHPQTNGICERFNKTCLNEFYQITFRKKIYHTVEALQEDLDAWQEKYNTRRTHQGKHCQGRSPMQTFLDNLPTAKEKNDVGSEGSLTAVS